MTPELITVPSFHVAGVSVRTSNAREADPATAQIGAAWQQFFATPAEGRLDGHLSYGVYREYESDQDGQYTLTIGAEVRSGGIEVPAGTYLVFTSRGAMPQAVLEGWKVVWSYFGDPSAPHRRAFTTDFERHDDADPETVRIHIAVV